MGRYDFWDYFGYIIQIQLERERSKTNLWGDKSIETRMSDVWCWEWSRVWWWRSHKGLGRWVGQKQASGFSWRQGWGGGSYGEVAKVLLLFPADTFQVNHPVCSMETKPLTHSKETVLTLELSMWAAMSRGWWIWELRVYEMSRVLPQTERNVHLLMAMVMMVPYPRRLLLRIQHNNRHAWPRECLPLYICLGNGASHMVL